jgi:amidohydrolase
MLDIKAEALSLKDYILAQRHYLHAHPELGRCEVNTTAHIVEELKKLGIEVQTFKDITGCVGIIKGGYPGKTVMLRADIDALPITEHPNGRAYASTTAGVMHACGHDAHTAMLLGAAHILAAHRKELHGTVKLLFQMGEEIGTESRHYVEEGALDDVDAIFGQHVWNLLEHGTANLEDGERMACSDRFTITIHGKAAHGSAPQEGRDSIVAAAAVVMALQTLVSRRNDPKNTFVLTVGMMNGGTASNVIADKTELVGTTRTFNKEFRKMLPEQIKSVADGVCAAYGCTADCTYFFGPAPLINDHHELNEIARAGYRAMLGDKALVPMAKQMGAEDFSVYMEKTPGVFGFLGSRNEAKGLTSPHHHPDFEPDEDVLPYGAGVYAYFAIHFLNEN